MLIYILFFVILAASSWSRNIHFWIIIHPFSNCFSLMWVSGRAAQHLVVIYIFSILCILYYIIYIFR